MSPEPLLSPELSQAIGTELEPSVVAVERQMVKRLVEAIGDPRPRWHAEMPPALLLTWMMSGGRMSPRFPPAINWMMSDGERDTPPPFTGILDGGGEWEFFQPVKLGEVITSSLRLADIQQKQGRLGQMLIITWECQHHNQPGHLVARSRGSLIAY